MKIQDLLNKKAMLLNLRAKRKNEAIDEMIKCLNDNGIISDIDEFKKGIMYRESQGSTGIGEGVAIPHCKSICVNTPTVLFAKSEEGVDFDSVDGEKAYVFFMIATTEGTDDTHLEALAKLSQKLMKDGVVERLKKVNSTQEVMQIFNETDEEKKEKLNIGEKYIVAVTGCPTGIAHTYMAEESLKKSADKLGINIKVETNGASGIGNKLTDEDIANAIGVIVAADKTVEMDRFNGKRTLIVSVKEGIRDADKLIDEVLNNKPDIYVSKNSYKSSDNFSNKTDNLGKKFYKHLMAGVSQMLPFVIGGGISIALAFLIDNLLGVPKEGLGSLGSYNEAAAILKNIGGAAFSFMIPILAGFIAYSIGEKPGLVAGFVAGFIANSGMAFSKVPFAKGGEATLSLTGIPSGFLGALVGGFIAGGVILFLRKMFDKLPKSMQGIKAILIIPLFGVIITGFLMLFINIPMAAINTGINNFLNNLSGTSAVLIGLLVGAMMAVDMGGPINKAAYVFGTGTLAATVSGGGSVVMASVMAGGMVPPLAIFISTLLFRNKFTKEERNSGLTNIVMGFSFITEGAIPFAAADPIRAIPSFILGSGVAGALVGFFGIKLMAPHGGIFVIALTSAPVMYLIFILIGSFISGIVFGILKKNI